MRNVFEFLDKLGIPYELHEHKAVFTVAESKDVRIDAQFGENKNLFLRNKKGDKHYLVTIPGHKRLDIRNLEKILNEKKLNFGSPERLQKYLKLTPGSVSPFGLINDESGEVIYILDKELLENEYLGFHPNINTQTIILKTADFEKYLQAIGGEVRYMEL